MLADPLRTGGVGQAAVEHRLDHRVAARQRITDDDEVGLHPVELRGVVAFQKRNALGLELRAHRRIDLGVRAGDAMAKVARQDGHAGHEGPADPEDVQAHYGLGSSGGGRNGLVTASDSST